MKLYQYVFMSGGPLAISVAIKLAYIIELCPLSKGYCQQNRVPSGKIVPRALLLKKPLKKAVAFQHHQSSIDQFLFKHTNINLYLAILIVNFQLVIQTFI